MTPVLAQGLRADRSFERIYRRHVGDVYRYALAVLRNAADAEDVTQTTFMNAYRAYAAGERPRQPQNWLIAIAHNVCRQRFRQSQRRPQEVAFDDNVGDWLEEDDRGPSADDLRRALSHLAFNQRAALVMRELEGRSYVEIAEILGLSVTAVETLLFRARRALREQLEGALTCAEAERALSLEADDRLARAEKGPLRAHLRECADCAAGARRQRAQRSAWKALGALPVPTSLSSLFGGGGGAAIGVKAAAVAASAVAAGGLGLAGERHFTSHHPLRAKRHPATLQAPAKPAAVAPATDASATVPPLVRQGAPAAAGPHPGTARSGRRNGDGGSGARGSRGSNRPTEQHQPSVGDGGVQRQAPAAPARGQGGTTRSGESSHRRESHGPTVPERPRGQSQHGAGGATAPKTPEERGRPSGQGRGGNASATKPQAGGAAHKQARSQGRADGRGKHGADAPLTPQITEPPVQAPEASGP